MNKPVAWIGTRRHGETRVSIEKLANDDIPLYTHPAEPAICVGYWDNKTGAFHKHLTESQQKRVDEGFLQPVYTAGMLPVKELTLTDEEIKQLAYQHRWNGDVDFAKAILRKAQEK